MENRLKSAVDNLESLLVGTIKMQAMSIGQGKPFTCTFLIGDEKIASMDATEFFRDLTTLLFFKKGMKAFFESVSLDGEDISVRFKVSKEQYEKYNDAFGLVCGNVRLKIDSDGE